MMETATSDREEIGKRLRYQVVKMSQNSVTAPEMRACVSRCVSLLEPLEESGVPEDRCRLREMEQHLGAQGYNPLTETERRDIVASCREVVDRISAQFKSDAISDVIKEDAMRPEQTPARNGTAPPAEASSLETENKALKEKLAAAYRTILDKEKLLAAAIEDNKNLTAEVKQAHADALPSAPPGPDPALAALETRVASMEQEVAHLLSQPDPPRAEPPPPAPAKPARKTPNEMLLDRLDSRLRNGQNPAA